jgi:hypothetical protein
MAKPHESFLIAGNFSAISESSASVYNDLLVLVQNFSKQEKFLLLSFYKSLTTAHPEFKGKTFCKEFAIESRFVSVAAVVPEEF